MSPGRGPRRLGVSVVIPAHDAEVWLAEAIDSALAQTHAPAEVIVVDDGSSDATAAIARGYGRGVTVVSQRHAGIGAARNAGVARAGGDVVVMLDADDRLTPASLAVRVGVLEEHPDVELVFGHERRFVWVLDGEPVALGPGVASELPGSMMVRREALARVGRFETATHVAEGLDWLLRARELPLIERTLPDHVVWRRVHSANNSVRHRSQMTEFAHALKASLDRRRAAGAPPRARGR